MVIFRSQDLHDEAKVIFSPAAKTRDGWSSASMALAPWLFSATTLARLGDTN